MKSVLLAASLIVAAAALSPAVAQQGPAATLKRLTPAAVRGDRQAIRSVAKAFVALGPRQIANASALRPRLRQEALRGSSASATAYALMLQHGIGGPRDAREAPGWLARGARRGNARASRQAAITYALGWGVRRDNKRALQLLAKLDRPARARQMIRISEALLQPGREEPEAALQWVRRAASLETASSVQASELYERLASADPKAAPLVREWLEAAAKKGNPRAALALGERMLLEPGGERRLEAARWLLLAAEQNEPRASRMLVALLVEDATLQPGASAVRDMLEQRASEGSAAARLSLADAQNYQPWETAGHSQQAVDHLSLAAQDGDPQAQYRLAVALLAGETGEPKRELARAYLSLAASKGYPLAMSAITKKDAFSPADARKVIAAAATKTQ
ncbi:tetratricopeptide repeat protein [Tianweitania sediminis]|uniref:Sel1 repeat family protein n=2 Tax=Tianweitania sediminis TaxID=1502156 RepID=A0A8J7UL69_9HYPH|nr:sel1 repeat family protein [Tianweitania sediminis]